MLRRWPFIVVGLTGSVATGKSTAATMIRDLGIPVFDADAAVHSLLGPGGKAVPAVAAVFPGVINECVVDRRILGNKVFKNFDRLKDLEAILHPLVKEERTLFLKQCAARRQSLVVIDAPLLFETGGYKTCDFVMVVSAPHFVQEQRVLRRPGMNETKLAGILARQISDVEKRRRADEVVPSGSGKRETLRRIIKCLKVARRKRRKMLRRLPCVK